MFGISEAELIQWIIARAYEPALVYSVVTGLLVLGSFGFPLPEEVPILGAGLVAHVARHPELYPVPPNAGDPVNMWFLAALCFVAVIGADYIVFSIGRHLEARFRGRPRFEKIFRSAAFAKAEALSVKYGALACGVFRFTPGLRFPGHMACGFLGIRPWKFLAIDGTAALLSVPTQVLLVGFYGEVIFENLKPIKMGLLAIVTVAALYFLAKKFFVHRARPADSNGPTA